MRSKRGQEAVGMSFGMIFALFLIVVFVVFAFMAANFFLGFGKSASVGMFYDELQEAVNDALSEQESDSVFAIDLPEGIERVCFANLSEEITNLGDDYDSIKFSNDNANVFLLPPEKVQDMKYKFIEHIDLVEITTKSNPYCVDVADGLRIQKGFYSRLVCLGEDCVVATGAPSSAPENKVCQLAEDEDTCDWLHFAKGDGYKEACCEEYELCC